MGVSGGAKGALEGPSMMPGGTKAAYDAIESLVRKMAAQVDDGPCVTYIGPGGAGHFVKTVHNGIEYGIEQILAEAYDLMKRSAGMNGEAMADVLNQWNATEELSSFLVEITEICLRTKDPADGADLVEKIVDAAGQKGTGLWTVVSALEMGMSVPTIYAALNARVVSSMRTERLGRGSCCCRRPHAVDLGSAAGHGPADGCLRARLHRQLRPGHGAAAGGLQAARLQPRHVGHWPDLERGLHHSRPPAAAHPERLHRTRLICRT